jgi:hypothetical protein
VHRAWAGLQAPLIFAVFFLMEWAFLSPGEKFLGDLTYEWVGFETDLERPMVGISEKARHIGGGLVPEEVGSHLSLDVGSDGGLSRLVFATQAVEHVKPLGGSLFALTAAVPSGLFVELPLRVRLTF